MYIHHIWERVQNTLLLHFMRSASMHFWKFIFFEEQDQKPKTYPFSGEHQSTPMILYTLSWPECSKVWTQIIFHSMDTMCHKLWRYSKVWIQCGKILQSMDTLWHNMQRAEKANPLDDKFKVEASREDREWIISHNISNYIHSILTMLWYLTKEYLNIWHLTFNTEWYHSIWQTFAKRKIAPN